MEYAKPVSSSLGASLQKGLKASTVIVVFWALGFPCCTWFNTTWVTVGLVFKFMIRLSALTVQVQVQGSSPCQGRANHLNNFQTCRLVPWGEQKANKLI